MSRDRDAAPAGRAQRLGRWAVHEMTRFVVLFLYLWILFGVFVLHQSIVLREHGISYSAQGFALINALVLAKVMLVAEDLNLSRWLDRRPLIYPILHESLLFTALFIAFHVLEELAVGLVHGETLAQSVPAIGGGGFAGLVCVAVIFFFALIPFFGFRNLSRAIGPDRMKTLLFGSWTAPASSGERR
jgi:hypothetical protein